MINLILSIFVAMDINTNLKIGIIGSGSWATAMIKMLTDNFKDKEVLWWVRKEEDIEYINNYHHNPNYLSAVEIKVKSENIYSQVTDVIQHADIVILNTPAAYLQAALEGVKSEDFDGKIVVSAIKGIIPKDNVVIGHYLEQYFDVPSDKIVVVGGPCHAEEVAQEKLSYLTFGCKNEDTARLIAECFSNRYIKTITSPDIMGIEYGAVLKNIYALAGGICHGLGYGDNFQAVLVSNAITEMEYFVNALEPSDRDIKASAYLGDLLVTAYSQFSRNRTFGSMIGKGYTVQSAQLEMNMVAEGYYASGCIQNIIHQHNLDMPICNMVFQVLHNHKSVAQEVSKLAQNLK